MTYQVPVSLPEILRTTLYMVDHTEYTGKESKAVAELRDCLIKAIAELAAKETTTGATDDSASSSD